jgi:hypothetical protein
MRKIKLDKYGIWVIINVKSPNFICPCTGPDGPAQNSFLFERRVRMWRRHSVACATVLLAFFLPVPVLVSGVSVQDFRVNPSGLEGIPHYNANIAFDQYGNFVVAWVDRGLEHENRQVYFQRYDSLANPVGTPVLVSDTTIKMHDYPDIAMSPSGSFVICWDALTGGGAYEGRDVWVQGFDSLGEPAWSRQQANKVRPVQYYNDSHPSIAMDNEDNSVVVWQTEDPTGRNVYAQRFNSSGEKIGSNLLVSDINASNYDLCEWLTLFPGVAFNSGGYFWVSWHSCIMCQPTANASLARVYNPAGEPVTLVFPIVNPCSSYWDYSCEGTPTSNSRNDFVVAFTGNDTLWTYPNNAVLVQTFDTLGAPVDSVKFVNDAIDLGTVWHHPRIAVDGFDGYIILWSDMRMFPHGNLWAQRFDASGEPVGQNYRINIPPGSLSSEDGQYGDWYMYSVSIHHNTVGFAWVDYRNWPTYDTDVYAKLLDIDVIGIYLPGDVVLDGMVDLADVIYLLNFLFRDGPAPLPEWTGDVTSDGEVNISDVIYLLNYLFRSGPPPRP